MNSTTYSAQSGAPGAERPGALGTVRTIITRKGHTGPRKRSNVPAPLKPPGVLTGLREPSRHERAWLRLDTLRGYTAEKAQRMCGCARLGDVEVWRGEKTVKMRGVMNCKSPMRCPRCGDRIAYARAQAIERAVTAWQESGGEVCLVTLTLRHHHTPLQTGIADVLHAWSDMWLGRRRDTWHYIGVEGAVRSLEATHGRARGWHPHMHALFFCRAGVDVDAVRHHLSAQWLQRVDASVERGTRVDLVRRTSEDVKRASGYVAKGATNELVYGADKEAARKHRTPMQLLDVRSERARALWLEWESAVKHRKAHAWVAKGRIEAVTGRIEWQAEAELLGDDVPDQTPTLRLSAETWRDLRHIRAIAAVLAIVRIGLDTKFLVMYDKCRRSLEHGDYALLRTCVRRC